MRHTFIYIIKSYTNFEERTKKTKTDMNFRIEGSSTLKLLIRGWIYFYPILCVHNLYTFTILMLKIKKKIANKIKSNRNKKKKLSTNVVILIFQFHTDKAQCFIWTYSYYMEFRNPTKWAFLLYEGFWLTFRFIHWILNNVYIDIKSDICFLKHKTMYVQ